MLNYRFDVYHQSIAYAYLYVYFLFLLLLKLYLKPDLKFYTIFVLLAGLTPHFRATAIIYGSVLAICALLLIKSKIPITKLIKASALFFFFPILLLILNYSRYGSFMEFGYSLNISSFDLNDYSLRFDYPYAKENLASAALELFGALFQEKFNITAFSFDLKYFNLQSSLPRFREFLFPTYGQLDLAVLLFCFLSGAYFFLFRLKRIHTSIPIKSQLYNYLPLIVFTLFILLACFYVYSPTMVSRYLLDFQLVINISYLFLFLSLLRIFSSKHPIKSIAEL